MGAISDIKVSFTCPGCKIRGGHSLMHVERAFIKRGKAPTVTTRCRCRRCEQPIFLTYYTWKSRKGLYRLRVHNCMFNGELYPGKRYRVLQPVPVKGKRRKR
jgi:hypothetical protein